MQQPDQSVSVFVFTFHRPDGLWGAICDRNGLLVVTGYQVLADAFCKVLARRGLDVTALRRDPIQIARIVASHHKDVTDIVDHVVFIERVADHDTAEDALWRAINLANAIPATDLADWTRTHAPAEAPS